MIAWILKPIYLDSNSRSANYYVNSASYLTFRCLCFLVCKWTQRSTWLLWVDFMLRVLNQCLALTKCSVHVCCSVCSVAVHQERTPWQALGWAATWDSDLEGSPLPRESHKGINGQLQSHTVGVAVLCRQAQAAMGTRGGAARLGGSGLRGGVYPGRLPGRDVT